MTVIGRLIRSGGRRAAVVAAGIAAAGFAAGVSLLWVLAAGQPAPMPAPIETALPSAGALPETPAVVTAGVDGGLTVPAVDPAAVARIPPLNGREPLPAAPDPALIVITPKGTLPKIAADGRAARDVYARPFDRRDDRARIAVIVVGIGLSRVASDAAIERLPGQIVLAIDAAAHPPGAWAQAARRAGHEILASLPLDAPGAVSDRAGSGAIRAVAAVADPLKRLDDVLGHFTGYVGVIALGRNAAGSQGAALTQALAGLGGSGLLLVDASTGAEAPLFRGAAAGKLPVAHVDLVIDQEPSAQAVDRQLVRLAALAREQLVAVGLAHCYPVTFERLRAWIATLDEQRFVLAPISAVAGTVVTP